MHQRCEAWQWNPTACVLKQQLHLQSAPRGGSQSFKIARKKKLNDGVVEGVRASNQSYRCGLLALMTVGVIKVEAHTPFCAHRIENKFSGNKLPQAQ